jgi:TPR repeat protein
LPGRWPPPGMPRHWRSSASSPATPSRPRPRPRARFWKRRRRAARRTVSWRLGRAHQLGQLGLAPDAAEALAHYDRAAAAGSAVAEVNIIGLVARGALGDPDWPRLSAGWRQLAEDGVPGAAVMLADVLAAGRGGIADPIRARDVAAEAAGRGDQRALRLLAWMELQGVGGWRDVTRGLRTLDRAWRAGNAAAATDLGLLHRDGPEGLSPDPGLARDWFERAARAGDGWGATHLARLLGDGDDRVPDAPELAFDLLRAGDARGIAAATHGLAIAHWDGVGTAPDPGRARAVMIARRSCGFSTRGQRSGRDVGDRRRRRSRCLPRGGALRGGGAGGRYAWARGTWPIFCSTRMSRPPTGPRAMPGASGPRILPRMRGRAGPFRALCRGDRRSHRR